MSTCGRTVFAVLAVALSGVLSLSIAATSEARNATTITIGLKGSSFQGKVRGGSHPICIDGRRVKLYRQIEGPDKVFGSVRTTVNGFWSIPTGNRLVPGTYYAAVQVMTIHDTPVFCAAAKSGRIVLD